MGQQILSLPDADDLERLEDQRAIIKAHLDERGLNQFQFAAGKLGTLRALMQESVFGPNQTYELQSMGVVLGDVFVQEMGFHWIIVEDEYGRDPALRFEDTNVILYPLTMLSKRIERGEEVDVFELYNGIANVASREIAAKGTD